MLNKLTTPDAVNKYARRSTSSLSTTTKGQPSTFVIEIGTRLTRLGFAGEHSPRHVFRTQFVDQFRPNLKTRLYDPKRDPVEQERILISFLKDVIFGKLLKNPVESRFIIVDSLFSTMAFRSLLERALFKTRVMNAAAIGFVPAPLMNVIAMNAKTALVIDTGINECLFYPVFDRVVLWQEFDATPCSTLMVENRIRELMKVHGRVQTKDGKERSMNDKDLKLFDDLDCAEDICHRFCFATTRERSLEMQTNIDTFKFAPSVKLPFGSEFLVVPGIVRETAAEVVLTHDHNERSIAQLVVEFIDRASIEVRKQYLSSLLFVGGLSNMNGFLSRIREEIEFLLDDYFDGRYSALKSYIGFFVNPEPLATKFCTAWIGASLSSSFDLVEYTTPSEKSPAK